MTALTTLAVTLGVVAASQQLTSADQLAQTPITQAWAEEYRRLVVLYGTDSAKALAQRLTWDASRLPRIQAASRSQIGWLDDVVMLRAAAMLETDFALQMIGNGLKARKSTFEPAEVWLVLSRRRDKASEEFLGAWYLAVGRLLLWDSDESLAEYWINRGLAMFPTHAGLLLASGTLKESFATWMSPAPIDNAAASSSYAASRAGRERDYKLDQAILAFRGTLAVEPRHAEARLRLGHALLLGGHAEWARREIQAALALPATSRLHYLALLFLGQADEADKRVDVAASHYERAIDLEPDAHSAYLALAHLRSSAGDEPGATAIVERMLGRPQADDTRDPWLFYRFGLESQAPRLFTELRRKVQK